MRRTVLMQTPGKIGTLSIGRLAPGKIGIRSYRKMQLPPDFSAEIYSDLCSCKAMAVAGSDTHMTGLEAPEGIFEENVSTLDCWIPPSIRILGWWISRIKMLCRWISTIS